MKANKFHEIAVMAVSLCLTGGGHAAQGQRDVGNDMSKEVVRESLGVDTEEYTSTEIIAGRWGTGPGEFGHILIQAAGEVPEGQEPIKITIGPDCIFVDEVGNIHVLDQINKRIQNFSSIGTFISATPLAFPEDVIFSDIYSFPEMYIDRDGYIFISYSIGPFSWFIFDKSGALVKRLVNKKSIEYQIQMLNDASSQKQQKAVLEHIVSDGKTILVDVPMTSARYDSKGAIYIGNMRVKKGNPDKVPADEMKINTLLTAAQRTGNSLPRAQKTVHAPKNGKPIRLSNDATGQQCVSLKGEVYKIMQNDGFDRELPLKVIRWGKTK